MWQVKRFATYAKQESWVAANDRRYQIVRLFVENGYAVEYRKLRVVY